LNRTLFFLLWFFFFFFCGVSFFLCLCPRLLCKLSRLPLEKHRILFVSVSGIYLSSANPLSVRKAVAALVLHSPQIMDRSRSLSADHCPYQSRFPFALYLSFPPPPLFQTVSCSVLIFHGTSCRGGPPSSLSEMKQSTLVAATRFSCTPVLLCRGLIPSPPLSPPVNVVLGSFAPPQLFSL